jgi:uncharacterized repeat protein (TIGR01451 family)
VAVDLTVDRRRALTGGSLVYNVTVENLGPLPARDVNVFVQAPKGTRFRSATAPRGDLRTPPVGGPGPIGWRLGVIGVGESVTLPVEVAVAGRGGEFLKASAYLVSETFDPAGGNNRSTATTRVQSAGDALITWNPPDPTTGDLAPPTDISVSPTRESFEKMAVPLATKRADETVVCYNVYVGSTPNVEPTDENYFTSLPPNQTATTAPVAPAGSFFTVTATYGTGESATSGSDGTGDEPGATLTKVKLKDSKVTAKGTGFVGPVEVLLDGIPFADASALKKEGAKTIQKGALVTGQTISQYTESGETYLLIFRNADGGVTFVEVVR